MPGYARFRTPIDRLWLGLSYTSHVFNTGRGGDFPLNDANRPKVQAAPGQGQVCYDLSARNPNTCPGNDVVTMALPDMLQLAARIEVNPRFDLEAQARWIHYGQRSNLSVDLQGPAIDRLATSRAAAIPAEILLDRGLQDAWGFEVSGRWRVGDKLRLSPSLMFETAAVDTSAVNAASIDAPKLDLALVAEWRPIKHLMIGAHVGGTAYILGQAGQRFDPQAQVACVDAGYNLDACGASNRGDGLPAANGTYTYFVVHFGAAVGLDY